MTKNQRVNTPAQRLLVPPYILSIGKTLTAISPFLASRFAARLFLTPFKYKLPQREVEMDKNSLQEPISIPSINREIVVYHYGDSPNKILLIHGWSGRGTQLAMIAKALVDRGYGVISFDAPAHGKAPGKISMMPFFSKTAHFLEEKYGPFKAAIAHSLGGMAALKAVKEGLKLEQLVIIGTANSVTHITKDFAKNMELNLDVANRMKRYLEKKFKEDLDHYSGGVSAKGVKIPTLVIHDKDDVDVHVSSAYEIVENLNRGQLYITEKLGHRRILGNEKVIQKILQFLSE